DENDGAHVPVWNDVERERGSRMPGSHVERSGIARRQTTFAHTMLDTGWPKSVWPSPFGVVSSNKQNCTQAVPRVSVCQPPCLPPSWSTANLPTCDFPSQSTGLRWLSSQRAAVPPKPLPSSESFGSNVPPSFCLTDTHKCDGLFTGSATVQR